jgi:hypothetical protein
VANLGTVLQQPTSVAATLSEIGPVNALSGHMYYMSKQGWNLAHNACDVLKGRSVVDIPKGLISKGEKLGAYPMEVLDQVMVGGAFLGALKKGLQEGMETVKAISYANDVAGRTQARYQKIARPPILRHQILRNTIGMFQTFTVNLFNYTFHDIPKVKAQKGTYQFMKTALLMLTSVLAINQIYKKAGLRKPYDLSSFLPFLGSAKFGLPPHMEITKGVFDILANKGDTTKQRQNLPKDFFYYMAFPFGGGMAKKIVSALKGESRTAPSKTSPKGKLRFRIEGADIIRTLIGGEWQTEEGQEYLRKKGVLPQYNKLWYILTGEKVSDVGVKPVHAAELLSPISSGKKENVADKQRQYKLALKYREENPEWYAKNVGEKGEKNIFGFTLTDWNKAILPSTKKLKKEFDGLDQVLPPKEIASIVAESSKKNKIESSVIAAVLWQESGYNPKARNENKQDGKVISVDRGIAQINNKAYPNVTDEQADDPKFAIDFMGRELKKHLDYFDGDINKAIAAYNRGRTRVEENGIDELGQRYIDGVGKNMTEKMREKLGLKVSSEKIGMKML